MNNAANIEMPNVKCPFLVGLTKMSISCEGLKCAKNMMWFETDTAKSEYVQRYCNEYPNECPLAKLLEAKYEESM